MRTQTKHILQRKLYCQWQRGYIQKGFFFFFFYHNILYSDLDLNSPTPVLKVHLLSKFPWPLLVTVLQVSRYKFYFNTVAKETVIISDLFNHSHWPRTSCTSACSSLGNQCHGIFPIKQNNTFIKPQAWLLQGYAHRHNGTLYNS